MPAPEIIQQLVAKFTENRDSYRSGKYNEARLRQEFLDPFFEALGWDIYNRAGVAPDYADVVIEDSLEIEGAAKAPDYAFKIGRERKFYVEAKKPRVDIQYDIHPAYQLRRYAWNAKLPLSILTDFEELAVYNCKNKPNPTDSAATGRDKFYRYTEYVEKWDEIAAIFSRDAVWKGSFDRFAESSKGKKGTTEVDDAILADIEDWRKLLALNIALRNPQVADERQLNYAVQMTIDRILFLRICEDRGIEPDEQLKALTAEASIYPRLVDLFRRADKKYNSGLFHFEKEKGDTAPADTFTPTLAIDDKVLKEIIHKVYYPCPYIFKEIPVEILGQVYEQFLGKVVRITSPGHARIEEKPEVRKAGGVYYTPQYIVDYIVANTVGKLLEGKTPDEAVALKIVDPACGSGSFLLGAFQYLLDWHEDWYLNHDPETWAKSKSPALVASSGGSWKLTTQKKKEILVNNIHGVDIDPQAVEVTKLSLLLKVLEEESGQLSLGFERVLPDLGRNIQCGNSLIGDDYFEGQLVIDEKERQRVNPFDWHTAFPQVFTKGGFDAVIGNPPYVGFQGFTEDKAYFRTRYVSAVGRFDIYLPFIERGISLLHENGLFGYICPTNFTKRGYGKEIRVFLKTKTKIIRIVDFEDVQIFDKALNYTGIFIFEKSLPDDKVQLHYLSRSLEDQGNYIAQSSLGNESWVFQVGESSKVVDKILQQKTGLLGDIAEDISEGIVTGKNDVFLLTKEMAGQLLLESDLLKLCVRGRQLRKYYIENVTEVVLYPYESISGETKVISPSRMEKEFPHTWEYLRENKKNLSGRDYFDHSTKNWYELWCQRNKDSQLSNKILVPELAESNRFTIETQNLFYGDTVCGITLKQSSNFSIYYLLGILNSSLIEFFYKKTTVPKANKFYIYKPMFLKTIPIRTIDFSNPADVKRHEQMVALVTRMLDLHKRVGATPHESEQLSRDIASTDRQIDTLVYDLYALTPAEIKIVESPS